MLRSRVSDSGLGAAQQITTSKVIIGVSGTGTTGTILTAGSTYGVTGRFKTF